MLARILQGAFALMALLYTVAETPGQAGPVSILAYSETQCADCARMASVLSAIQETYSGKVRVETRYLRTSDPGFRSETVLEAEALGVTALPTLFVQGRRISGFVDESSLSRLLDTALGKVLADEREALRVGAFPRMGSDISPEIVVFSDFQCPYCSVLAPKLEEFARSGKASVRFVHYPLDFHTKAPAAHRAAFAAGRQGKFWEMHDRIFAVQADLAPATFERYAEELGLDLDRFQEDVASDEASAILAFGIEEGDRIGIGGTPAVYVNGRQLLVAPTEDNLHKALATLETSADPASAPAEPALLSLVGDQSSPISLEWFFDAHGATTQASWQTVQAILAQQRPDLQLVARHLPMDFHRTAKATHHALEFAAQHGKFAEFLQLLMADTRDPDTDRLVSIAMRLGLDVAALSGRLADGTLAPALDRDTRRAAALGIKGVPTFVLNGKRVEGLPDAATLLARMDQDSTVTNASLPTHAGGAQEE